jgi:hypothetical protein
LPAGGVACAATSTCSPLDGEFQQQQLTFYAQRFLDRHGAHLVKRQQQPMQ